VAKVLLIAAIALVLLPLSGCFNGKDSFFRPGEGFTETGRTVHLKATVVDYDQEVYPGLQTWLWAFCFAPVDPNDAYSAAAIEGWTARDGDGPASDQGDAKCGVPGPTLRVKQGDRVKVEFSNSHFHPHTIHWHGQYVPWESDGAPGVTQDSVESGGSYTYNFIASRAGTLWYHCHVDTQFHVQQGLYGMMIVEPQDTSLEPKDVDREYTMVLSTMNRNVVEQVGKSRHSHPPGCASGFPGCENPSSLAGEPDVFLINGYSYPYTMEQKESLFVVKEGERIRLRILNAGETIEEIHPHGHDMLVTHKDGNPIPEGARVWQDVLKIGPGERYDVIIEANNPGPWMIHTHVNSHETNCGKSPGGMHTMLVYEDYLDKMHQFKSELPATCNAGELKLPGDYVNVTEVAFGTSAQQSRVTSWSVPVELVCAVKRFTVQADLDSFTPPATPVPVPDSTTVTFTVKDPSGSVVESKTLSTSASSASYTLERELLRDLKQGNYTIEVSASQSAQASVDLFANVDYHETFEETKVAHLTYKVGGCPGYT
jgi:hypothetical protein